MKLNFSKYQGTGNDFILIDNRLGSLDLNRAKISELCNRRFGIGGDGLILLNSHPEYDFRMSNYNADGGECTMCGNGGRALVQFAFDLGIKKEFYRFLAGDGAHEAIIDRSGSVQLKMKDVLELRKTPVGMALDTGSPHLVVLTKDLLGLDVASEGRRLRTSSLFMPSGINVNFVEIKDSNFFIRTYERGVEDETLSCGTGAIASAIVCTLSDTEISKKREVIIQCQGGKLSVRFERLSENEFKDIWLFGEVKLVFQGSVE